MREDWIETKLDDIAKWGSGGTPKSTIPEYYDGDIPWLIIGDLNDSYVSTSEKKITELGLKNSSAKWVKADSVLIAMYGSIGKLGINKIPVTTNQAIAFTQTLYGDIQNKFLFYYLLLCRPKLHKVGKGGTQKNISQTVLKTIDFPLAPLLEQKAIVAKIEQLFSELDNAVANLKTAKEKLKIYRQAVLKKAFEGELTKEWREKQTNLPTADKLLEQIKKEREVHYKQQLEEWKQAVKEWEENGQDGKKPSKPKQVKFQNELSNDIINNLENLPKTWKWIKWEQILKYGSESFKRGPFGSALKKSFFVESGYKVYEQYCPINDDCSYERYYITNEKFEEMKNFAVEANDFLISCSGVTLGRITQVPDDFKEGVINQALLRVRLNIKFYNSHFFKILFRSHYFQQKIFDNSTGSAIPNVKGVNELKAIPLPICSLEEQNQIVQEIESRLSVCDKIEETIEISLTKSEALRQSILKKAFERKLLSEQELENIKNHPEYESAKALLKRIKNEREK